VKRRVIKNSLIAIIALFGFAGLVYADCLDPMPEGMIICEDFDDQSVDSPLLVWNTNGGLYSFDPVNAHGEAGYSLRGNHANGEDTVVSWYPAQLYNDIYIRYYIQYDSNYNWHDACNVKLVKFHNPNRGLNWETIWRKPGTFDNPDDYPSRLKIDISQDGNFGCQGVIWGLPWGDTLTNGQWHKVEIFFQYNTNTQCDGVLRIRIDDQTVIDRTNMQFRTTQGTSSDFYNNMQLYSIRAAGGCTAILLLGKEVTCWMMWCFM